VLVVKFEFEIILATSLCWQQLSFLWSLPLRKKRLKSDLGVEVELCEKFSAAGRIISVG